MKFSFLSTPVFDSQHLKQYLGYGAIAATAYFIPVVLFLCNNSYQHLYYLFIGCALFMSSIFFYVSRLLNTPYDEKRAVSMLIAGHMATLTGIFIASLMIIVAMLFLKYNVFSGVPSEQVLPGAPSQNQQKTPAYLLLMILSTTIIGNFSTGSFISVIVSYAGKRDQTRDKPVDVGQGKSGVKV